MGHRLGAAALFACFGGAAARRAMPAYLPMVYSAQLVSDGSHRLSEMARGFEEISRGEIGGGSRRGRVRREHDRTGAGAEFEAGTRARPRVAGARRRALPR